MPDALEKFGPSPMTRAMDRLQPGPDAIPIPKERNPMLDINLALQKARDLERSSPVSLKRIRGGGMLIVRGKF